MSHPTDHPADELVYPADITRDFLYQFFQAAYFSVQRDEVDDLYIKDGFTIWIFPQQEGEHIRFMSQFRANPTVPRELKLEYVNRVNDGLQLVRAYVDDDNDIGFDYYLALAGGITKRSIALAMRYFTECVRAAVQRADNDIL